MTTQEVQNDLSGLFEGLFSIYLYYILSDMPYELSQIQLPIVTLPATGLLGATLEW